MSEESTEVIKKVRNFLEENCKGSNCIATMVVFDALKSELKVTKTRFYKIINEAITESKELENFELRRGRGGGIHRAGIFREHDEEREKESERTKRQYNKREIKTTTCRVIISNNEFIVKTDESRLLHFIFSVLDGQLSSSENNIQIGELKIKIDNIEIFERYIINFIGIDKKSINQN